MAGHDEDTIDKDWFGRVIAPPIHYSVWPTPTKLYFRFTVPLGNAPILVGRPGEFCEGLWDGDVAELFISSEADSQYIEFNLGASGAWWMQHFAAYRARTPDTPRTPVIISSEIRENNWTGSIEIPVDDLALDIDCKILFNACFILGDNPRHFISASGGISDIEPDFHRRELLRPLILTSER